MNGSSPIAGRVITVPGLIVLTSAVGRAGSRRLRRILCARGTRRPPRPARARRPPRSVAAPCRSGVAKPAHRGRATDRMRNRRGPGDGPYAGPPRPGDGPYAKPPGAGRRTVRKTTGAGRRTVRKTAGAGRRAICGPGRWRNGRTRAVGRTETRAALRTETRAAPRTGNPAPAADRTAGRGRTAVRSGAGLRDPVAASVPPPDRRASPILAPGSVAGDACTKPGNRDERR
jgi:hypothetical protein